MVGTIPLPSGAPGKRPLGPGTDGLLPPNPVAPSLPIQSMDSRDLFKTLVDTITLSNMRVRKLNALKKIHRLDLGNPQQVSDDEEESQIPDTGTALPVSPAMPPNPTLNLVASNPITVV